MKRNLFKEVVESLYNEEYLKSKTLIEEMYLEMTNNPKECLTSLVLYKKYNPVDYPKYDNYNAINVNKVVDIPVDYFDIMGVPITFLDKYNPEQFEIIGHTHSGDCSIEVEKIRLSSKNRHRGLINGKQIYDRILIRRK